MKRLIAMVALVAGCGQPWETPEGQYIWPGDYCPCKMTGSKLICPLPDHPDDEPEVLATCRESADGYCRWEAER